MSAPSTTVEFKIVAYGSLFGVFIACIGLLTLNEHFKQHDIPYKQVKLFALLAHLCLLIEEINSAITMNSAIFYDLHKNYQIITDINCTYMLIIISASNFLTRYFINAFSLSRLKYFFNSSSMSLNNKIYYGWLILYAILSFFVLIFICIILY